MGTVDGDFEGPKEADRRAEVIEWLNALLPEYCLPLDSSDEELRELLSDGTVLCQIVNTLIPGALEGSWSVYASPEQQSGNVKKFLTVVADMGLPGFSVKDLEEVASLKDTIVRKDTEIEQLQVMKDKVKSPSFAIDINGASMSNNSNSDLGSASSITTNQQSQLSDPQSYTEVNRDGHTSPTGITATCLDEADFEDNASEDGFSNSFSDRPADTSIQRVSSRIGRFSLTKNGQPAMSRPKPKDTALKTPNQSRVQSSQLIGGSSVRASKRWQK